jgi:hypothetical protein
MDEVAGQKPAERKARIPSGSGCGAKIGGFANRARRKIKNPPTSQNPRILCRFTRQNWQNNRQPPPVLKYLPTGNGIRPQA